MKVASKKPKKTTAAEAERTADMLKAVADTDRLRIVMYLREGPKNVGELAKLLGIEIVNVSHHLSVLRRRKVVINQKHGRFVAYSLNPEYYTAQDGKVDSLKLGRCRLEIF
jgi:ArsR family transcriptional regulator